MGTRASRDARVLLNVQIFFEALTSSLLEPKKPPSAWSREGSLSRNVENPWLGGGGGGKGSLDPSELVLH
ncbi:hypothetical protein ATOBIA_N13800 [Atopobiaceae bacterium P1]|uniref:Uncharacterized protein n=1 Tax=Leptogranulimonas caecicola TaxID=2894156 RepID=A0AAU9CY98_9ACTN|nr:hypothetical protein ATOBIA_N13800 [Atopobiaceae bacterium P1]BDC91483.1 hypothetical protein ATTO_13550 [Leptogranulimonas caecicola]